MSEAKKKSSRWLDFALIFAIAYLISQVAIHYFLPSTPETPSASATGVLLTMEGAGVRDGNAAVVIVENTSNKPLTLPDNCPKPPFQAFRVDSQASASGTMTPMEAKDGIDCVATPAIAPGEKASVSLAPWKYSMFGTNGVYELRLAGAGTGAVTRFERYDANVVIKIYRAFITKPFLNFLVLVASVLPDHNLGIGIILLTLLVKIILFFPTQRSLEGQKKMQLLQPKLEALKKQYAGDAQKQHEETVKLWKEHGVNPFQSCLPLVLQFPILIGLFHVIRDGVSIELSRHLIYPFFADINWSFGTMFLGLDLTKPYIYIFPPALVLLQFLQMRLTFHIANKKKQATSDAPQDEAQKAQDIQQKIMTYALPLMIGFFAWRLPSAVSLYWGVSTLFAIGQQMIVNREHLKV